MCRPRRNLRCAKTRRPRFRLRRERERRSFYFAPVTEKATALSERGVYAFEVARNATERAIEIAIRSLYKVSPVKVAFVPIRSKEIIVKGKKGRTKGGKKAYVYLKKGEKIEVM